MRRSLTNNTGNYCRTTQYLKEGFADEPEDRKCCDCMEVLDENNAKRHEELNAKDPEYCLVPDEAGFDDNAMCDHCWLTIALDEIGGLKYKNELLREALEDKKLK